MANSSFDITEQTTVREVMTQYPQAERIFARYGLTGCGGKRGPVEPIGFFATVHGVDATALLQELNEVVGSAATPSAPAAAEVQEEPPIYKPFVKSSIIIALTVGCTLGAVQLAVMGFGKSVASNWPAVIQAHGQAQLFGWVGLFIMGVAYYTLPRLKQTTLAAPSLAMASFFLVLIGLSIRTVGQPWMTHSPIDGLVVGSGLLLVIGAVFYVTVVLKTLIGSKGQGDFYDKFIVASGLWFLLSTFAEFGNDVYLAHRGVNTVPDKIEVPFLHVTLMGFIVMMIFAYTLRTMPPFMGLRAPNKKVFGVIFWVVNAGVLLVVVPTYVRALTDVRALLTVATVGAVVEFIAIVAFVYFLNVFRKPEMDISEAGAVRGYEKYIRAAYAWLLVAATMIAVISLYEGISGRVITHSLVGSYRHALTVGFITMMIFGVSSRIIPVFTGVRLYSARLLLIAFVLLNVGNAVRVISQPLADFVGGPFYYSMGLSGSLEVIAIFIFGYNIWRTMGKSAEEEESYEVVSMEEHDAGAPIRRNMIVGDILERYPSTLNVFVAHGFEQLKNPVARAVLAKTVTVEQASRIHQIELENFLADLNAEVLLSGAQPAAKPNA